MGVNTLREDPIDRMKAVGFIREYHNWYLNEGNPTSNPAEYSAAYPNAQYKWNKVYQDLTFTRFADFYSTIRDTHDIQISPSFLGNLFQIVDPTRYTKMADDGQVQEQKPIIASANSLLPASYVAHAAYLFQYAARYGHNTFSSTDFNNLIVPATHPKETPKTGLGIVEYMENWNEQDKWWWRGSHPNTYFNPQEYAAMLSADYDGHGNTLGAGVGIKNADPDMKVVMGGLAEADLNYIREMVDWSITNRTPLNPTAGVLPFQVLNIHHYIGDNPIFLQSTQGISPERADLRTFLQTFDAYRDSLSEKMNTPIELWLSEFGYDTYGPPTTAPSPAMAPSIGSNDSYEVQGQWITRIYLEALAAGIDRAMVFFLRDEPNAHVGLYSSSGLVENITNNYKPKNSWFYTYTMKNTLKDMVFDTIMSPCLDTACARVYRFKELNGGTKEVYALWSPTESDKKFNYVLDVPENLNGATLTRMELPSIHGVNTVLTSENPTIEVSERPVFVVVNGTPFQSQTCAANLLVENATCSSLNVRLNAPNNSTTYQLWYMQGSFSAVDFSHRLATLVDENVVASDSVITVANLQANENYTFFLFPEGVGHSETSKICTVVGATNNSSCKIAIDPNWIFDDYENDLNPDGLFDNQSQFDPMCNPNDGFPNTTELWGFNYSFDDSINVSIDLQAYYYLDALTLHDEGSRGLFTVQTAPSPNGPWTTAIDYITIDYNKWTTLTNIFPHHEPIRYLRFIGEEDESAKVGEVFLCGRLSNYNPDILPGTGVDGLVKNITCNSLALEWKHPFDQDIQSYKIILNGSVLNTIPYSVGTQTVPYSNLMEGTTYNYGIVTVDNANQESSDTLKLSATTMAGISGCKIPLTTAMIFDHFNQLGDAQKLVDEQNVYDPICHPGYWPTNNLWGSNFSNNESNEHVSFDLQAYHNIDKIYIHDGGGSSGNLKIFRADSPNGPWTQIVNYDAVAFNNWIMFSEPIPNDAPTRYLRFEANKEDGVATGEIFICGTLTSFNPDIVPSKGSNGQILQINCDSVQIAWTHPFDTDLKEYQIFGGPTTLTLPYSAAAPTLTIKNLSPNTDYTFKIISVDLADQESADSLTISLTTNQLGECDLTCVYDCPCAICLKPSWLTANAIMFDKAKLVDEQDKVPHCNSTGQAPNSFWNYHYAGGTFPAEVEIDLQAYYDIDKVHFFFQGGSGQTFTVSYKDESGNWVDFVNYTTNSTYGWSAYDNLTFKTRYLKLSQPDQGASVGEIGVCGTQLAPCLPNLSVTAISQTVDTFQADAVTSTAAIAANHDITFLAQNSIALTAGFHAQANSTFTAKIADCLYEMPSFSEPTDVAFARLSSSKDNFLAENSLQIFPNPFHYQTTIAYHIADATSVDLTIFDGTGKTIKKLVTNELLPEGKYKVTFQNELVQAGFYYARLRMGKAILLKKMVVIN